VKENLLNLPPDEEGRKNLIEKFASENERPVPDLCLIL
jgi:hypothetical protein